MFENPLESPEEKKEQRGHRYLIDIFLVVVALGFLIGLRVLYKGTKQKVQTTATTASQLATADPVKDLKVQRATMTKDSFGTTAVWSVNLVNKSEKFAYTAIVYQTDYIGADNNLILENTGTINTTIGPNAEDSFEIRDAAYPNGTAWFKFKVTGAKAKVE